jgi:hypothetical protein
MGRGYGTGKSDRQRLRDQCDALWREIIYLRDRRTCQMPLCGRQGRYVQAHHLFSRRRTSTRWEPDNGLCLCAKHHIWGAHEHPVRFHEFLRKRLGPARYNELLIRSEQTVRPDMAAVHLFLAEYLQTLRARVTQTGHGDSSRISD